MANFWRVLTAPTPTHLIASVITIAALAAFALCWVATLDGVPAVGYYRMGVTMAVAGIVIAWVISLRNRCVSLEQENRRKDARLNALESRVAATEDVQTTLLDDAHIRKVITEARKAGHPLLTRDRN